VALIIFALCGSFKITQIMTDVSTTIFIRILIVQLYIKDSMRSHEKQYMNEINRDSIYGNDKKI